MATLMLHNHMLEISQTNNASIGNLCGDAGSRSYRTGDRMGHRPGAPVACNNWACMSSA